MRDNRSVDKRRMCSQCRAFITSDDKVCPYCDSKVGARAIDLRMPDAIGGLIPADRFVTMLLLMINTALYVATVVISARKGAFDLRGGLFSFGSVDYGTLSAFGMNEFIYVNAGHWWRLLTAGFLHLSLLHIAMNMWSLLSVGAQVEEIFGSSRMVVIYLFSTFTGFWSSYYFHHGSSAGASAGLFGLVGAMIALGSLHRTSSFAQAAKAMYLQTAIYGLVIGFLGYLPMDNWAHVGGLAGGYCMARLTGVDNKDGGPKDRTWNWGAAAAVAITAFAFAKLIQYSFLR
jgi:rhomboid protease GluP